MILHLAEEQGPALRRYAALVLEAEGEPTLAGAAAELDAIGLRRILERMLEPGDLELLADVARALDHPAEPRGGHAGKPPARAWAVASA